MRTTKSPTKTMIRYTITQYMREPLEEGKKGPHTFMVHERAVVGSRGRGVADCPPRQIFDDARTNAAKEISHVIEAAYDEEDEEAEKGEQRWEQEETESS
jgi:hypothetical protein